MATAAKRGVKIGGKEALIIAVGLGLGGTALGWGISQGGRVGQASPDSPTRPGPAIGAGKSIPVSNPSEGSFSIVSPPLLPTPVESMENLARHFVSNDGVLSFDYPASWNISINEYGQVYVTVKETGTNPRDKSYKGEIQLTAEKLGENTNNFDAIVKDEIDRTKYFAPNGSIFEYPPAPIAPKGAENATSIYLHFKWEGRNVTELESFFRHKDILYIIRTSSYDETQERTSNALKQVLDSWEFGK